MVTAVLLATVMLATPMGNTIEVKAYHQLSAPTEEAVGKACKELGTKSTEAIAEDMNQEITVRLAGIPHKMIHAEIQCVITPPVKAAGVDS